MAPTDLSIAELNRRLATAREVRGVRLPEKARWPARRVTGAGFFDVDFNGVFLARRFGRRARFEDCDFERCRLASVRLERVDFVGCRFREVELGMAQRSYIGDSRFERCTFEACRFGDSTLKSVTFADARFDGSVARVQFQGCELRDFVAAGRWFESNLVDCQLVRSDWRGAQLSGLTLYGSTLREVGLPANDTEFYLRLDDLSAALDEVAPSLSEPGAEALRKLAWTFRRARIVDVCLELLEASLPRADVPVVVAALRRRALEGVVTDPP